MMLAKYMTFGRNATLLPGYWRKPAFYRRLLMSTLVYLWFGLIIVPWILITKPLVWIYYAINYVDQKWGITRW